MGAGAEGRETQFGALLRRHRIAAGLTQEALAEHAAVSSAAVSALERGVRRAPHRRTTERLAEALDLDDEQRSALLAAARVPRRRRHGTAPATPHNLPDPAASMVGRDDDHGAAVNLLTASARLVTLVGPGGVGKTLLAVTASHRLLDRYPDGVWFVDLSAVARAKFVAAAVASVAAVLEPQLDPLDALVLGLARRRVLLVLDNCEHVLDASAAVVAQVLRDCPNVSVLATSRAPLRVHVEHELAIEPLASADEGVGDGWCAPEAAARYPAVGLFADRARAVDSTFVLDERNGDAVAALCRRLDGLPLAIELAAQWVRTFDVDQLLRRLEGSLALLREGRRDAPERHRTLRDTVRWSYDLLDAIDQAVFRRLSAFAGGAPLDAVAAVCNAAGALAGDDDPLVSVNRLVAASLVRRDASDGDTRLSMLVTIQEFAAELLAEHDEVAETRAAHADHFAALVRELRPGLYGPDLPDVIDHLRRERDNVRALPRVGDDRRRRPDSRSRGRHGARALLGHPRRARRVAYVARGASP